MPSKSLHFNWAICALILCLPYGADAQSNTGESSWWSDAQPIRWETGALVTGVTLLGLNSWDWGSSHHFRWNPEGWFGTQTGSGGSDKLGHAFSSYAITNGLSARLQQHGYSAPRAAWTAAMTTQAIMLYVEWFDGFSNDHGFAREDVVMNLLGSGLAYARQVHPALGRQLDFRIEYQPSGYKGFRPLSDYEGQTYLMAWKPAGGTTWGSSPLRYLELQWGYRARGFSAAAIAAGVERHRESFVGVGLNLSEWFWGRRSEGESGSVQAGRFFFEHVNVPHTSLRSEIR